MPKSRLGRPCYASLPGLVTRALASETVVVTEVLHVFRFFAITTTSQFRSPASQCVLPPTMECITSHAKKYTLSANVPKSIKKQAPVIEIDTTNSLQLPTIDTLSTFLATEEFTPHNSITTKAWLEPCHPVGVAMGSVPRIPISMGYQCTQCAKCFGTEATSQKQKATHHNKPNMVSVAVQALLPCIGRHYVCVEYTFDACQKPNTASQQLEMQLAAIRRLTPSNIPTHKERNAWLQQSKWPELAASFIPKDATYESIAQPIQFKCDNDNVAIQQIQGMVTLYMQKFKLVATDIDYQFLRLVMGLNDNGNVPTRGLRVHSIPETSNRYCRYLCGLVCGLLRACDPNQKDMHHLLGPLNDIQSNYCSGLLSCLEESPRNENSSLVMLHNFLISIWTPNEQSQQIQVRGRYNSLVLRFLILSSMQKPPPGQGGFGFQHVATVTGRCSILIYWIRATILMEIGASLW